MAQGAGAHGRKPIGRPHRRSGRHKPKEERANATSRGYGYKWEKFRKVFLREHPLCEYCLGRGRVEPAIVCDHDLPHEHDADLFWNNTFTALCKWDHDSTKQRMERQYKGEELLEAIKYCKAHGEAPCGSGSWVDYVPNAGAVLVYGPPCGGKTTWALRHAQEVDADVYDLDDAAEAMGLPRYGRTRWQSKSALRFMMKQLSQHDVHRRLILVTTAPTAHRRQFWAQLVEAASVRLISASERECLCVGRVFGSKGRMI